jgi:hypothetical protein
MVEFTLLFPVLALLLFGVIQFGIELNVFVTPTSANWDPGSDVTVRATYPYSISLLGVVVKSGTLTSSTTERVE